MNPSSSIRSLNNQNAIHPAAVIDSLYEYLVAKGGLKRPGLAHLSQIDGVIERQPVSVF